MPTINPQTAQFFEQLFRAMKPPVGLKVGQDFARKYPRLMRKVNFKIGPTGPALGLTGIAHRKPGQGFWNWMRSPAHPEVTISSRQLPPVIPTGLMKGWSSEKVMRFAAGHELQHAREILGKSNARFAAHSLLNKAFVPYGWRANEWRANTVGAQVAKLTPHEIRQMRKQNLTIGAAGAGVRTAVGGGAYALYRSRRRKS